MLILAFSSCRQEAPRPADRTGEEGEGGPLPIEALEIRYSYRNLDRAWAFYGGVLGFRTVADHGPVKVLEVSSSLYLTLVDASVSLHSPAPPKTATLAVLTEELEAWWAYLQGQGVPVRAVLKADAGRRHDGFVVLDPESYSLEFKRFNPHPENALLLPRLEEGGSLYPAAGGTLLGPEPRRPQQLGVQAAVVWLYYQDLSRMEVFWTEALGRPVLLDHGWAKVVETAPTGFIGIVDGSRCLQRAASEKEVVLAFLTRRPEAWKKRMAWVPGFAFRLGGGIQTSSWVEVGVAGTDPEDYPVEWTWPRDLPANRIWLKKLGLDPGSGTS